MTELYLQQFGFFGDELNQRLYQLAIGKNDHFSRSKTSSSQYYPEWRKSKVIYHDQFEWFKYKIEADIRKRLQQVLVALRVAPFDIASFEVQLTSHNDGEYYKWHTDNSSPDTASRLITFVYYFHSIPKAFSGGELVIYHRDQSHVIEPVNDSIVFFHSGRRHEVKPVVCPSKLFEHGRFTLNGWVRYRPPSRPANDHFGYNIFQYKKPAGV